MKTIGIVTSSRADYGIYRPVMTAIKAAESLELAVIATGMHLEPRFDTLGEIEDDGFEIAERIPVSLDGDSACDIASAIGMGVAGFAQLFDRWQPDMLLIQGDRFDIYSAALASLPFGIPLAHMHGGELTLGAIDDPLRHSITKMAHLHFVSAEVYAARVRQLGEEDWRVHVCGAPGLDNLNSITLMPAAAMAHELDWAQEFSPLLVTVHPETRDYADTEKHISEILSALIHYDGLILFTAPNADTHSNVIRKAIEIFCARHSNARFVANLGTKRYFSAMAAATAMIGNSSSGIVEAASFSLPVINVGDRQKGRLSGDNVIHVPPTAGLISEALDKSLDPDFRCSIAGMINPYGDGHAAERIGSVLESMPIDSRLLNKQFVDR